jgi:hypothetical protein
VAFTSPVDNVSQVFVVPASGGVPIQLTSGDHDGMVESFSRDGAEIYFREPGTNDLLAVPLLGGRSRPVLRGVLRASASSSGDALYCLRPGSHGVFRADARGGRVEELHRFQATPRPVATLPFALPSDNYDFTRDLSAVVFGTELALADLFHVRETATPLALSTGGLERRR